MSSIKFTAYWIHCNRCFVEHIRKRHPYFLLNCEHVICGRCLGDMKKDIYGLPAYKCPICEKDARACKLDKYMPKKLKELFHPEPYLNGLNTFRLVQFQTEHRQRYMEHLKNEHQNLSQQLENQQKDKMNESLKKMDAERKQLERSSFSRKQQPYRNEDICQH